MTDREDQKGSESHIQAENLNQKSLKSENTIPAGANTKSMPDSKEKQILKPVTAQWAEYSKEEASLIQERVEKEVKLLYRQRSDIREISW